MPKVNPAYLSAPFELMVFWDREAEVYNPIIYRRCLNEPLADRLSRLSSLCGGCLPSGHPLPFPFPPRFDQDGFVPWEIENTA